MHQFSNDNSPVEMELLSGHLLFADPLYFQHMINNYYGIDTSGIDGKRELVIVFEETFFPHGGAVLLGYKKVAKNTDTYLFEPARIKKWKTDDGQQLALAQQKQITTFGIDTASFLIIDVDNLEKFMSIFSYDSLIDAYLENQLDKYFETTNKQIANKAWAYVISRGVDSGDVFDSNGLYIVE